MDGEQEKFRKKMRVPNKTKKLPKKKRKKFGSKELQLRRK